MRRETRVAPGQTVQELLDRLGALDIRIWLDGEHLRCSAPAGTLSAEMRDELRARRDEVRAALGGASIDSAGAGDADELAPLTLAQERVWFFQQLEPESAAYNINAIVTLTGPLDMAALHLGATAIVRRQQILRTTFPAQAGVPRQHVHPAVPVHLSIEDLSAVSADARDADAQTIWKREASRPFDLSSDLPFRLVLVRLSAFEHLLIITLHHIAADGGSLIVFMRELVEHYRAGLGDNLAVLPALPMQYATHARQQRQWLISEQGEKALSFWTEQFSGELPVLDLPTDHPRPAVQTFRGGAKYAVLPPETAALVRALSRRYGCTPFMTLLAAFKAVLYRCTGAEDIVVGSPLAGRDRAETRDLIGLLINTIALRSDLSGNPSFEELIGRVRTTCFKAFAHQELPFGRLLEAVRPERDLSRAPLFQVMFNMFGLEAAERAAVGDLVFEAPPTERLITAYDAQSKFDLTLYARETAAGIELALVYNADLFSDARMHAFLASFATLVENAGRTPAARIGDIAIAPDPAGAPARRAVHRLRPAPFEPIGADVVRHSIGARFREVAERHADRLAICGASQSWTYRELQGATDRLAAVVNRAALGHATRVALLCDHDASMVAAILGVLEQGSAYVPLDSSFPEERLTSLVEDAAVTVILADRRHAELARALAAGRLPVVFSDAAAPSVVRAPRVPPSAASPAYILYTSGSTGRPKGVMQTHAGVLHHARTYANSIELTSADRVLLLASYTFDAAVMDIFGALFSGATLHLASVQTNGLDAPADAIGRHRITIYHSTPTVYRALVQMLRPEQCASLRCVVLGGEEVRARDLANFRTLMPAGTVFVNGLGPTESTTALQYFFDGRTEPAGLTVPVGYPVDSTEIQLLNERGEIDPVVGEIAIVSPYVATGYWNRPDLTARAFQPVPGCPDVRQYRTGDRGRRRPDGTIEFLGRSDQQVKIRGVRVELGEIEACLEAHPAVRMCAVTTSPAPDGEPRLVAFVVAHDDADVTEAMLKDYLSSRLPGCMTPAALMLCPSLPLTPTGKIDRRSLPAVSAAARSAIEHVEPRDATEELVADTWRSVLGVVRIGIHDNFFALGGHSLNATQVIARLRSILSVEVPLRALFAAPTVEGLAKVVRDLRGQRTVVEPPMLPARAPGAASRLSYSQERMWFMQQLLPDGTAYNINGAVTFRGALDREAFLASVAAIAARHEILRTTFSMSGGAPVQHATPSVPVSIVEQDLRDLAEADRLPEAQRLAAGFGARPFDLEQGPLWRTLLLRLSDDHHVVMFSMHHIAGDLWSLGVLSSELTALYNARVRGRAADLAPLEMQYADYAAWQRQWLEGDRLQEQLEYWTPRLANLQPLELPTDRPRPPIQTSNGDQLLLDLPSDLVERVRAFSVREGATPFMTFLAAFNVLLSRYSGQYDLAVGVPIANRTRLAVERVIGTFVNTLVLRNDLSGNPSFLDVLRRVRGVALDAFAHQDVPFERLVRELTLQRDASRTPLFQVMFNMASAPLPPPDLTGLRVEPLDVERRASQFDLTFLVHDAVRPTLAVSFNSDLFDRTTIQRLMRHYLTLLDAATREPDRPIGQLEVMPAAERRWLLGDVNRTSAEYPNEPVTSLIAEAAARTPDATAIEHGRIALTYAELEASANRLARWLSRTVAPGARVGVCLDRSPNTVVALLAVMKARCAYIPIDPAYPAQRVKFMLEDSGAVAVVTESRSRRRLPSTAVIVDLDADAACIAAESPAALDETAPAMDSLAYVLYTSGSTGNPKGVQIPHRALVNFLWSMQKTPGFSAGEVLLAVTTISFDIAGLELYLTLVSGGTIALAGRDEAADGRRLRDLLVRRQPSVMQATPATWRGLIDAGWSAGETPALRVFCGGEALPRDLADGLLARAAEVWNLYGPTETTIWSTAHRVTRGTDTVPIGTPIANTRVYVLDTRGEPTPPGVPGELFIGGDGLADGYLDRPELTAERFVRDPFDEAAGARMYRTGDRARFRPDGRLEHLGRLDHQVKLRGYRIELGEIESALGTLAAVGHAVADVRGDRLVAYVVFAKGEEMTASEIRAALRDTLPDYMIPSLVVPLDALPLTPNGKVDRRALPDPLRAGSRASVEYVAPSTPTEIAIADVWRVVLGVDRVSTSDNFFELGGHSLLSIRAVQEIQERTGWRPDPRLLFFETLGRIASARFEGAR